VTVTLVTFATGQVYLPSSAGAPDKVEHFAWLHWRKVCLLSFVVQSIHNVFQDVERREPSYAAAVERQQAEPCAVQRAWLSAALGRCSLLHSWIDSQLRALLKVSRLQTNRLRSSIASVQQGPMIAGMNGERCALKHWTALAIRWLDAYPTPACSSSQTPSNEALWQLYAIANQ
jgi:hypothetical protein